MGDRVPKCHRNQNRCTAALPHLSARQRCIVLLSYVYIKLVGMIHLSQSAALEIQRLKSRRKNPALVFRLGLQPSACLDMAYRMEFDDAAEPGDQIFDSHDVQIVVSAEALPYVDGLVLDYSEDLMGGGFRFHNPNALQSCGCGNAFATNVNL